MTFLSSAQGLPEALKCVLPWVAARGPHVPAMSSLIAETARKVLLTTTATTAATTTDNATCLPTRFCHSFSLLNADVQFKGVYPEFTVRGLKPLPCFPGGGFLLRGSGSGWKRALRPLQGLDG